MASYKGTRRSIRATPLNIPIPPSRTTVRIFLPLVDDVEGLLEDAGLAVDDVLAEMHLNPNVDTSLLGDDIVISVMFSDKRNARRFAGEISGELMLNKIDHRIEIS